jgi:hypothetical protein
MADDLQENELPPEKPALKIGLKGCAIALLGVIFMSVLVGVVLRIWG